MADWWQRHSARLLKAYHGWGIWFWLGMVLLAWWLGWLDSVRFVSLLSIWALVETKFGAWQASRAEVRVEKTEEVNADDVTVQAADRVEKGK